MTFISDKLSRWINVHVITFLFLTLLLSFSVLIYIVDYELDELNEQRCEARKDNISNLLVTKHNSLRHELHELANNNTLRVNLMLKVKNQIKEVLTNFNSENKSSVFIIDSDENVFIGSDLFETQTVYNMISLFKNEHMADSHHECIYHYHFHKFNNTFYWFMHYEIIHRGKQIGRIFLIYDFKNDIEFNSYIQEKGDHLQLNINNKLINLVGHDINLVHSDHHDYDSHRKYTFKYDKSLTILLHNRLSAAKTTILLAIILLMGTSVLLSIPFAIFIYRKVNTPLGYLLKQSQEIIKHPDYKFDCDNTVFNEFKIMCSSFNDMINELRSAEDKYRFLIENMEDALWMVNMDLQYTYVSPSMENVSGHTYEEMFEVTPLDTISKDGQEILTTLFNDRLKRKDYSNELVVLKALHKEGFEYWAEMNLSFITESDGTPIGIQGITRDITARILAEEKIKESEEKFRMITENSSDIVWTVDTDFNFQYVSPSVTRILGYSKEEALLRNFKDLIEPKSYEFIMAIVKDVLRGKEIVEPLTFEMQEYKKDGELRWMEVSASTVRDKDNKIIGFQGVTRDIHEKWIALEAVKSSEERYSTFVNNFQGIVFQGLIGKSPVFFHGAVEKITGWTEQDMLNSKITWRKIVHPEDIEINQKPMIKLSTIPGYMDERVYRIIRKDKSVKWIRENIHNICEGGICKYLQGVITDITEQKELELALQQTNKMSWLGEMAAGIAHEINNPLTGMLQWGELLLEDLEEPDNIEAMTDILDGTERIRKITKTLLNFSRSDSKKLPNDINEIITDAIDYSSHRLKRYKINISYYPTSYTPVLCDASLIQQIFINLINNSIDAINDSDNMTDAREILIALTLKDVNADKIVIINFKDTGVGIDDEDLDKIFDPFYTTKEPGKGTGLGMSLTHYFIQDSNGSICVDSIKGEWTEFKIKFPLYED